MEELTDEGALGEWRRNQRQPGSLQFHEASQKGKPGSTDDCSYVKSNGSEGRQDGQEKGEAGKGQENRTTQMGRRGLKLGMGTH